MESAETLQRSPRLNQLLPELRQETERQVDMPRLFALEETGHRIAGSRFLVETQQNVIVTVKNRDLSFHGGTV